MSTCDEGMALTMARGVAMAARPKTCGGDDGRRPDRRPATQIRAEGVEPNTAKARVRLTF